MDLGLKDKVALVSGASKGLGYAIAHRFAQEGAKVAICSRQQKEIEAAAEKIRAVTGATVVPSVVDVTRADEIKKWVADSHHQFGAIHICITNTAGPPSMEFMETTDELWQNAINLTLMSAVRLSQAVIPIMKQQSFGRIIHLCSVSVRNPIPNLIFSNSLRSAVVALGKTQADELAQYGILVNSALPGWTGTDRTIEIMRGRAKRMGDTVEEAIAARQELIPLRRIAKPEEIADPIVFLASERASFITGVALAIDGGEARFPF